MNKKDPLVGLGLPADVEEQTRTILSDIRALKRVSTKGDLLFAVYHAYLALGRVYNPLELGRLFGVDFHVKIKKISKAYYAAGYACPLVTYKPGDYLPVCCVAASIPPQEIPNLIELLDKVVQRIRLGEEPVPCVIAAGVALYYATSVISLDVDVAAFLCALGIAESKRTPVDLIRQLAEKADNASPPESLTV